MTEFWDEGLAAQRCSTRTELGKWTRKEEISEKNSTLLTNFGDNFKSLQNDLNFAMSQKSFKLTMFPESQHSWKYTFFPEYLQTLQKICSRSPKLLKCPQFPKFEDLLKSQQLYRISRISKIFQIEPNFKSLQFLQHYYTTKFREP